MNDAISRRAALEKVRAMQTYKLFEGDDMILVDKAEVQTELMMLPTAQPEVLACGNGELVAKPEPQWIPVSERLPEESEYYIITANDGVGHRTTFAKFQKKAKSWDLTGARSYWRVIAWMPLPEPYGKEDLRDEQT